MGFRSRIKSKIKRIIGQQEEKNSATNIREALASLPDKPDSDGFYAVAFFFLISRICPTSLKCFQAARTRFGSMQCAHSVVLAAGSFGKRWKFGSGMCAISQPASQRSWSMYSNADAISSPVKASRASPMASS